MKRGFSSWSLVSAPPQVSPSVSLCMRPAILAAMLGLSGLGLQPAPAQAVGVQSSVVAGRVLDLESGRPIEAVQVRLTGEGSEFRRLTDRRGTFMFAEVPAGAYTLALDHLAYGTHADSLEVVAGEYLELVLRLAMRPIELEPLAVTVRRRPISPRARGFYERLERSSGYFITREDIEGRQPLRITHMIQAQVPGVRLIPLDAFGNLIVFRRHGRICAPAVYVDGVPVGGTLDGFVIPNEVEGVEVYKGPATVPAQFARDAGCGVVALWTRSGPTVEPGAEVAASESLWKKLAIAAAVQTLVVAFVLII